MNSLKESLLQFMEATHAGVHGECIDADSGQPIEQAQCPI